LQEEKVKKVLSHIFTTVVLSSLLIPVPASAAPDGSLKKMLDTNITLIEYITLHVRLQSVERLAEGRVTKWGDYSSVVRMSALFDFEDSELTIVLNPVDDHYFSTVAEAKSYCRDLIRAELLDVWMILVLNSTPSGWSTGSLGGDDFVEKLSESSKIRVSVRRTYIDEKLPEEEYALNCTASLDKAGDIENFSYNL
jgi:hypothetical protein